jgi:uncharacterized protein
MRFMRATKHTVRLATVAIALAMASPVVYAQQPSAAALSTAKELVTITGTTSLFTPLVAGVIEQAKNLFLQQNPNLNKDLTEVANKMRNDLTPRLEEVNNEVARLYAARFTDPELKEILAFYKTPTGKKLLAEQPRVVDGSMKFAQDWANKLSNEVMGMMREEMKKKGHTL